MPSLFDYEKHNGIEPPDELREVGRIIAAKIVAAVPPCLNLETVPLPHGFVIGQCVGLTNGFAVIGGDIARRLQLGNYAFNGPFSNPCGPKSDLRPGAPLLGHLYFIGDAWKAGWLDVVVAWAAERMTHKSEETATLVSERQQAARTYAEELRASLQLAGTGV